MKFKFICLAVFCSFLLFSFSEKFDKFSLPVSRLENLAEAVNEVAKVLSRKASTVDLITEGPRRSFDFKEKLLLRIFAMPGIVMTQETPARISSRSIRKQRIIFLFETFDEFSKLYKNLLRKSFKFDGFYLIVLTNGRISQMAQIFSLLWKIQIFNVDVVFEDKMEKSLSKLSCRSTKITATTSRLSLSTSSRKESL